MKTEKKKIIIKSVQTKSPHMDLWNYTEDDLILTWWLGFPLCTDKYILLFSVQICMANLGFLNKLMHFFLHK